MANYERELLRVLVKITDYISDIELRKLKFIFCNDIQREGLVDTTTTGAINFFQQLLDRGIIDHQNLSKLINALEHVGSHRAAQHLKDYQLQTLHIVSMNSTVESHDTLLEEIHRDNNDDDDDHDQLDKQVIITIDPDIEEESIDFQHEYLLNNNNNTTPKSRINFKTNGKVLGKKDFIYMIILLIYTFILISLFCFIIITQYGQTKSSSVDKDNVHKQIRRYQRNAYEPYFIKSNSTGKSVSIENNNNNQSDEDNRSRRYQWYLIPSEAGEKETVYGIQSVYNNQVFEVSDENKIRFVNNTTNNVKQRFRLIYFPQENLYQIQSLATNEMLDGRTQTDLRIDTNESVSQRKTTLWQILPFNQDRQKKESTDSLYRSSINDLTRTKSGKIFGSNGDFTKDDPKLFELTNFHYISSISLTSADWLNSIEFIYSSPNFLNKEPSKLTILHGSRAVYDNNNNDKYRNEVFNVTERNSSERINRVDVVINHPNDNSIDPLNYIIGIRFHTTFNRTSPFYGSQQGQLLKEEYPNFVLGYVRSETHVHIVKLQFIWYKV